VGADVPVADDEVDAEEPAAVAATDEAPAPVEAVAPTPAPLAEVPPVVELDPMARAWKAAKVLAPVAGALIAPTIPC